MVYELYSIKRHAYHNCRFMKLAKGIFALGGKDGKVSTQKNLNRLERWAESDKVKFSRN